MAKWHFSVVALLLMQPVAADAATFVTGQSGNGFGSRLGALDRLVICPFGDPDNDGSTTAQPTGNGQPVDNCYSVSNSSSTREYFVPWNTSEEWTAFLNAQRQAMADFQGGQRPDKPDMSIGVVCPLQGAVTICKNTPFERVLDANSFNQREVGVLPPYNAPPLGRYAAQGDIFTLALTPRDDVTLTCLPTNAAGKGGKWLVTTAPDACQDAPAQCADGLDAATIKPWLSSDPQFLQNTGLCAPGNKVSNTEFRYHSAINWSWVCHGSGGTTAQCSGGYIKQPLNGQCGWFSGQTTNHDLADEYYSNGVFDPFRHFCDVGAVTDYRQTATGWTWRCDGVNGGQPSAPCASEFEAVNGVCGAAHNTAIPTAPNVQSGNLCASGFASPTTASLANGVYSWGCYGNSPPATTDQQCTARQCAICEGVNPAPQAFSITASASLALPNGSICPVQASASWTSSSTDRSAALDDALTYGNGRFSITLNYQNVAESDRCQPCYKRTRDYQGLKVTVSAKAGSCPGLPGLNGGQPLTLP